jgi:hypothetical protein
VRRSFCEPPPGQLSAASGYSWRQTVSGKRSVLMTSILVVMPLYRLVVNPKKGEGKGNRKDRVYQLKKRLRGVTAQLELHGVHSLSLTCPCACAYACVFVCFFGRTYKVNTLSLFRFVCVEFSSYTHRGTSATTLASTTPLPLCHSLTPMSLSPHSHTPSRFSSFSTNSVLTAPIPHHLTQDHAHTHKHNTHTHTHTHTHTTYTHTHTHIRTYATMRAHFSVA